VSVTSAVASVPIIESASQPDVAIKTGLSSTEARRRRAESGVAGCMSPVAVRQSAANKRRSSVAVLGHSDGGSAQITDLRGLTVKAEFLKVYSTPARTRRHAPPSPRTWAGVEQTFIGELTLPTLKGRSSYALVRLE
jgi:hypothetical protein